MHVRSSTQNVLLTYIHGFLCSSEIKYVQLKMSVLFKQKHDFQLVTQHYASGCCEKFV